MITIVNMIPKSLSGETNQDSEPGIAINPADTLQIVGSAFTPDPMRGPRAPIYVSDNGGDTWILNSILPSPISTHDITLGFSATTNNLYAGILVNTGRPGTTLNILRTNNFLGANPMETLSSRNEVDQPYIQATTVTSGNDAGKDRVYMGINDFSARPHTATIDQSLNAGITPASFTSTSIEKRNTIGQNGPQIRPAINSDGTIYGIFYGWRRDVPRGNDFDIICDVVVVREDKWGLSSEPFSALIDPGDNNVGVRVVSKVTVPWRNAPVLGFERIGGDLSIAVDPRNSSTVYIAWADQQNDDYILHLRSSKDRGVTWSSKDVRTISNAKNPALAINIDGKIGFLYQQHTIEKRWDTHLELTEDDFVNNEDIILATVPSDFPPMDFLPYNGDYIQLLAVDKNFYGIFSANNTPDLTNFPQGVKYQRIVDFNTHTLFDLQGRKVKVSIDPFFFKVT